MIDQLNGYKKIISFYGANNQKSKAIEELGELQRAIAKDQMGEYDRNNMLEEIADVENMISQLMIIYQLEDREVADIMAEKNIRTVNKIKQINQRIDELNVSKSTAETWKGEDL